MRCINKVKKCIALTLLCLLLTGCGKVSYTFSYDPDCSVSSYRIVNAGSFDTATAFASDLCVVSQDVLSDEIDMTDISAAALFKVNSSEVLYAKNVYEKLYPASLTKVMTALVALKYGNLEDTLTASEHCDHYGSGGTALRHQAGRYHDVGSGSPYPSSIFGKRRCRYDRRTYRRFRRRLCRSDE